MRVAQHTNNTDVLQLVDIIPRLAQPTSSADSIDMRLRAARFLMRAKVKPMLLGKFVVDLMPKSPRPRGKSTDMPVVKALLELQRVCTELTSSSWTPSRFKAKTGDGAKDGGEGHAYGIRGGGIFSDLFHPEPGVHEVFDAKKEDKYEHQRNMKRSKTCSSPRSTNTKMKIKETNENVEDLLIDKLDKDKDEHQRRHENIEDLLIDKIDEDKDENQRNMETSKTCSSPTSTKVSTTSTKA